MRDPIEELRIKSGAGKQEIYLCSLDSLYSVFGIISESVYYDLGLFYAGIRILDPRPIDGLPIPPKGLNKCISKLNDDINSLSVDKVVNNIKSLFETSSSIYYDDISECSVLCTYVCLSFFYINKIKSGFNFKLSSCVTKNVKFKLDVFLDEIERHLEDSILTGYEDDVFRI